MIIDFKAMYDYILSLDNNVRFIGFIDEMGKLVYGGMRPGKISLENETESIKIYMEYALINKIHTDFDTMLGKVIYSLTVREKIELLTFPLEKYIIRISLERHTDSQKIIYSILDYLKKLGYNWTI
ncbi:MAG: hypothetical protein H0U27_13610 [Nitrosopumilus sp.]|nr:hypothetical protein [Nitrosopumilus sp.]